MESQRPPALSSPTMGALITLATLVAIPYIVPNLERLRLLQPLPDGASVFTEPHAAAPTASVGETSLAIETKNEAPIPDAPLAPEAKSIATDSQAGKPPRSIEDPTGHALDAFYATLASVEHKDPKSIARITYYGDSIVASDYVTGTLRRRMQSRFGDAGHGFLLMASPWAGYAHNDVERFATKGWQVSRVVGPFAKDGLYGLGGVSFRSPGAGVLSQFWTAKTGKFGRAVSRFVIDYLEQPGGGAMDIAIDDKKVDTLSSDGPSIKSALKTYEVPDGEHKLEVKPTGPNVRAFGVWMERDEPGVVVDALGIQGCRIRFLDQTDDAHWADQLRLRNPSLVAFEYGMNESEDGELYPLDQYEATMKAVLEQVKAALPKSSCLLVGPMDRADKTAEGYKSRPIIPKLAAIQRRVSAQVGCGYWDTYGAMGGQGSMGTWVQRGLGSSDLTHPTGVGAEVIGNWLYLALAEGYDGYRAKAQVAH